MASKNEKAAAKAGQTLKQYKASKKKSSSKSSKGEKKAKKQVKKYYKEKESDVKKKASVDTARLQEDLSRIFQETGIAQNRAIEDYIRNLGNIEAEKDLDVKDLTDYVTTNKQRTGEDLETSLARETRRFAIESDRITNELADKGLTFSERTPEKIAQQGSKDIVETAQTEANRSFADISRYEAAKNAEIQLRYGQQTQGEEVRKVRTLEDILNDQQKAAQSVQRGTEDVAFGKSVNLRELDYEEADTLSDIEQTYEQQSNTLRNSAEKTSVFG